MSVLFRVLKYHTDCYVKNGFEVFKKRSRKTIIVPARTMVVWRRVLVVKIVSSEYGRYFE